MLDLEDFSNFKFENGTFTYEPFKGEFLKDAIRNMFYLSQTFNHTIIGTFNNKKIIMNPEDTVKSVLTRYYE